MNAKLIEQTCPKCNGEGLEVQEIWTVEFCNGNPYGCYRKTGNKVVCKSCMGVKTITVLEVTE